ncbi:MAG: hypothetical protein IPM36_14675 [Lewinellaceae bacterium]|nr:hypothetical protein [Lewinellaceae bacterium]
MNLQNIIQITFGLMLGASLPAWSQELPCNRDGAEPDSSRVELEAADTAPKTKRASAGKAKLWNGMQLTGGQLTLPFKIRPKAETNSFRLTTDVTVGAFVGLTKRLSLQKEYRLIIPLAAGLTFININDGNTSLDLALQEAEVVPGLTWSTGIILELDKYSLGLMFGKDYASEVGNQWNYHRKIWWSFGIGFAFFH